MDLDLLFLFPQIGARIMEGERGIKAQNVCNNGGEREQKRVQVMLANGEEGSLKGAAGKSAH